MAAAVGAYKSQRDKRAKKLHERRDSTNLIRGITRRISTALFSLIEPRGDSLSSIKEGKEDEDDLYNLDVINSGRDASGKLVSVHMGLGANH